MPISLQFLIFKDRHIKFQLKPSSFSFVSAIANASAESSGFGGSLDLSYT